MKTELRENIPHIGLSPRATPIYAGMSEVQLVQSCQRGDQMAFEYLIKNYESQVLGILHRLAPEQQDISDLAQNVMIRLWVSIGSLRNPYAFRTWLRRITTNVFYDELRRSGQHTVSIDCGRFQEDGSDGPLIQIVDRSATPAELVERKELSQTMMRALVQMPPQSRRMIVLRDLMGMSYKEIGDATNATLGTVKSRIARARVKMQVILSPYIDGEMEGMKISA